MSANRSVQAAQRRRMGQEMTSSSNMNSRGPQPSIGSSQMFNGQGRQMQQQQPPVQGRQMYQQSQAQTQSQQMQQDLATSKLTIAQAITLITLRLGALESKMMEQSTSTNISHDLGENMVIVEKEFMDSILERLDTLEKRPVTQVQGATNPVSQTITNDVAVLKQQFEPIKQATIHTKNAVVSLTKESKDIKSNYDCLKQELSETKDLLNSLQSMVMDNNNRLLNFSLGGDITGADSFDNNFVSMDNEEYVFKGDLNELHLEEPDNDNEIVGTNLKELIENEINLEN
jgi:hypothetical protein